MDILFTKEEIDFKTKLLAKQISDEHRTDGTPVIFICLLKGGFMFFSDLVKELSIDIELDFMRVKSYLSKNKQGDINILKDVETAIKGKHVYIVDDIYDSGRSMEAVTKYLKVKDPKSMNIVTLLKRKQSVVDPSGICETFSYGFEIDDEWIIGRGMDDEKGYARNYQNIFSV